MKTWKKIFLALYLVLLGLTITSCVSSFFNPLEFPYLSLIALSYSVLIFTHFIFLVFWIIQKSHFLWISFVMILIEVFVLNHFISINLPFNINTEDPTIRIATYNMQFSKTTSKNPNRTVSNFLNDQNDLDILCVQECGVRSKRLIESEMNFRIFAADGKPNKNQIEKAWTSYVKK